MLKKTKNVKLIRHFPCLVISCFLVFFIFLTDSVNVKADNTYTLPYNVVDYENNNSILLVNNRAIIGDAYTRIYNQIQNDRYFASGFDLDNYYILPVYSSVNNNGDLPCILYFVSGVTFSDTSSHGSIYANYLSGSLTEGAPYVSYILHSDGSYTYDSIWYRSSGNNTYLFGSYSPTSFGNYSYQNYYPVAATNYFYDSADNLVITVDFEWTPEDPTLNEFQNALDITSTISTGIDSSLTEIENQSGFFNTLIYNLKNMFNSLNGWINNGFTFLSGAIKNFFGPFLRNIQNFISEFKGSFEVFKDKWDHFFEIINSIYNMSLENGEFSLAKLISVLLVPDQTDLNNVFQGTPVYTLYTGVISAGNNFYSTITGVLSNNPVYVFSLPTFTFCGKTFTGLQVNFDWYVPYKSYGDVIISAFLIIGYIRFLMNFIPNFFYGSGFIDHDVNNIQGRTDHL